MPTFKLDGQEIPFEKGETIIQAAYRRGINVPHYCWHPGLSIAANCRMCLVEIEPAANQRPMMLDVVKWDESKKAFVPDKKPKLQPACQMAATEGMSVKSETSPHVAQARGHVQEFLLLNHPVDCPICDQAGECMLQDYYMSEQHAPKRMRDEPNHKPKAVPFGPTIVYDAERCIACTRCIRFCDEVAGDHMLDMRERGNMYEIITAPGRQLEGKYTMMTEYICPVGALTTKYWRHKGRVWLLKSNESVCPGCATGCNAYVDVDSREQTAFRVRPRDNVDVNKYWMCDDGMMTYLRVHKDRVLAASSGRGKSGEKLAIGDAITKAGEALAKAGASVAVVLSAQHSCEDNLVLADLAKAAGATLYLSGRKSWDGDTILRHTDQNPNRAGALKVSGSESLPGLGDLVKKISSYDAVIVLDTNADVSEDELAAIGNVATVVLLTSNVGPLSKHATLTIPVTTWAECDGTFVNAKGLAQEFHKGLTPKGDSQPAWEAIAKIGRAMKLDLAFKRFAEVRAALTTRLGAEPVASKADWSVDPYRQAPRAGV